MTNDESPVDVAAINAAPPEDTAPLAASVVASDEATPAEPSKPVRRRRPASTTPAPAAAAKPRARKTTTAAKPSTTVDSPEPPPVETVPAVETVAADEPAAVEAKPAPRRRTTGGTRRTSKTATAEPTPDPAPVAEAIVQVDESPVSAPAPNTEVADAPETPVTAEKPKPARRTTTRRKPAAAKAVPETVGPAVEVEPATTEPTETVAEVVQAEAVAPDSDDATAPSRSRRRGGRGRRKTDQVPAESVEAPAVEAEPVAPQPEAAAEEPAAKPARTRRGGTTRKRVEKVEEPEDLSGGRLVTKRGLVELQINGETFPPVMFFGNVEGEKEARKVTSQVQRAAQSGVHLHSTLVELACPLPPDDSVYETFDSRMETLIKADPKGYFIPRIVFVPATGWRRQYPNEVNHYADGSTDDPSIASDHFWSEAATSLTALIEHVQRMGYGERVVGYHLERGEWFHPVDGGYDRSYANREAFRAWLRNKYNNSEASLRAAWYDGQVQFYTVEVPTLPATIRPEVAFFEPRKDRRLVDFLEYTSEVTANRLISLAQAAKNASKNRALVSVCYGYTFEFGHTFSGHLALGQLLQSSAIDILAGPPSYRDRKPGGGGSYPAPADSMPLHGKLWLSEDDTKTHLSPGNSSPDDFNPRVDSRTGTEQVHRRAMGNALVHHSAVAWMDTWGEGWLDSEDIWKSIGAFTNRYRDLINSRKTWSPEVAVLVDERSLLHLQKGDTFVRKLLRDQYDMLQRSSASVGFYLQSDVLARNFPTDAKLYIFLTPYRLPADQRAAIKDKILKGGKTVVWMFAPGVCDSRGEPEEGAYDLVGLTLRQQSWNSELGTRITDTRHPISEGIHNRTVGARERLNPSFSIDDESKGVVVVGEYQQSGLPSIAAKEMDGWRTVFCGEPTLSPELLRGLYRYAGVHTYMPGGDDYVFAGDGLLTIHTVRDGNRIVNLPQGSELYSLDDMRLVTEGNREYRSFFKGQTTYSFYVGTPDEMRKFGLPVERIPASRRGRGRGTPAPEPVVETEETMEAAAPQPVDPDLLAEAPFEDVSAAEAAPAGEVTPRPQNRRRRRPTRDPHRTPQTNASSAPATQERAAAGDSAPEASGSAEGASEAAGETAEHKRRRRRRGGRGRGRRPRTEGEGGGGGGEAPAE